MRRPSRGDWRRLLNEVNRQDEEVDLLEDVTGKVAQRFSGSWSVDYLRDAEGMWWLIDMAPAERSWCWHEHSTAPSPGFWKESG